MQPGAHPCGSHTCRCCSYINTATTLHCPKGNFQIRQSADCKTADVIYTITCSECLQVYIGEAYGTLTLSGYSEIHMSLSTSVFLTTVFQTSQYVFSKKKITKANPSENCLKTHSLIALGLSNPWASMSNHKQV